MKPEPKTYTVFIPFDDKGRVEIAPGMFITRDTKLEALPSSGMSYRVTETGVEIEKHMTEEEDRAAEAFLKDMTARRISMALRRRRKNG